MHRNTFLDSPRLLDRYYADRRDPPVAFAGQKMCIRDRILSALTLLEVKGYVKRLPARYYELAKK